MHVMCHVVLTTYLVIIIFSILITISDEQCNTISIDECSEIQRIKLNCPGLISKQVVN